MKLLKDLISPFKQSIQPSLKILPWAKENKKVYLKAPVRVCKFCQYCNGGCGYPKLDTTGKSMREESRRDFRMSRVYV